ncbi:MAG: PQQ-binding-like beta-propeller repeat protein [Candidatus Methanofastidiosia archaeon]
MRNSCILLALVLISILQLPINGFGGGVPVWGDNFGGGAPVWSYRFDNINCVSMSDDGSYIVVGCSDGYYYILDIYGNICADDNIGSEICCADIASNTNFIIGTETGYTFKSLDKKIHGGFRSEKVFSLDISEDGSIAIVGAENRIYIVYVYQGELVKEVDTREPVKHVAVSSTGDVCIAEVGGDIFVFDLVNGREWRIETHKVITSIAISDDSRFLIYGTEEGRVCCYTLEENDSIFERKICESVAKVCINENGNSITAGASEGSLFLLTMAGDILWHQPIEGSLNTCSSSSNGELVVAGMAEGKIHVLNSRGETLWSYDLGSAVKNLLISEKGDSLFAASEESLYFFTLESQLFENTRFYPYPSELCLECGEMNEIWSQQGRGWPQIGDVNGDGKKEIVFIQNSRVAIFDVNQNNLWKSKVYDGKLMYVALFDVTGDTILDIVATSYYQEKLLLDFYDGTGNLLKHIELDLSVFKERKTEYSSYGAGILPKAFVDTDGDGKKELICILDTDYPLQPRGVICLEYESGNSKWFYPVGPHPVLQGFVDINGDGKQEILLGCDAPCNRKPGGHDRDDCYAAVFVIDLQGQELWAKNVGSGYKRVRLGVADVEGDGKKEVICTAYNSDKNWGQLSILDSQGKIIREETFNDYSVQWGGTADLRENGEKELLVMAFGDDFGELRMYDSHLRIISKYEYGEQLNDSSTLVIGDLDGDNEKEIILAPNYPEIVILNSDLKEIRRIPFPDAVKYVCVNNFSGCRNDAIFLSDKFYIYSYENEPKHPCIPWIIRKRRMQEEAGMLEDKSESEFQEKNFGQAIENLEAARKIYMDLGEEGKVKEIEENIERTRLYKEAYDLFEIGFQFHEDESCEGATQYLKEAKEKLKFLRENYNLLDEEQELKEIDKLLEDCNKVSIAKGHYDSGIMYYDIGNYEAAIKEFTEAKNIYEEVGFTSNTETIETRISMTEEILSRLEEFNYMRYLFLILFILSSILILFLFFKSRKLKTKSSKAIALLVLGVELSLFYGSLCVYEDVLAPLVSTFLAGFIMVLALVVALLAFCGLGVIMKGRRKYRRRSAGNETIEKKPHADMKPPEDLAREESVEQRISPDKGKTSEKDKLNELEKLKSSLARGEITLEEYNEKKSVLEHQKTEDRLL